MKAAGRGRGGGGNGGAIALTGDPEIAVLISTYDDRGHVEKKLAEIRAQTHFERAEFIFVETASPGRERELLAPFCQAHPNCRLVVREERTTLYEAWNLGWAVAAAPLICNSNMDDGMHPQLLERVAGAMRAGWDACSVLIAKAAAAGPGEGVYADFSPRRLHGLPLSLRPGPFTAWRADLRGRIGAFDGRFHAAGDKDFWARIGHHRLRVGLVGKVLYLYNKGPRQLSKAGRGDVRQENDRRLAAEKPYPQVWPWRLRRKIYWYRLAFRVLPGLFTVPVDAAEGCGGA